MKQLKLIDWSAPIRTISDKRVLKFHGSRSGYSGLCYGVEGLYVYHVDEYGRANGAANMWSSLDVENFDPKNP